MIFTAVRAHAGKPLWLSSCSGGNIATEGDTDVEDLKARLLQWPSITARAFDWNRYRSILHTHRLGGRNGRAFLVRRLLFPSL